MGIIQRQELYYAGAFKTRRFFYEQFVNEGAESASSLAFSYCTMINYGEYAGICALSEGIEYSEELQKEWNALQLTASSEEIKTTNDKACFKYISYPLIHHQIAVCFKV